MVAAPRRGELAGVRVVRRRRSEAWARGESKGARGIDSWGSCRARALARRDRRALQGALHGDAAVAAVGEVLGAAGRVAREGEGQREATGGGGGRARRVGASARRINGREGRGGAPRRWRAALSAAREKTEQGVEVEEKGRFAITKSSRD